MHLDFFALLRCPFCGTALDLVENEALERGPSHVTSGVIGCQCCAFPVVDGIPVLIANDRTRDAMHALEAGHREAALFMLLGLDSDDRAAAFRQLMVNPGRATYRRAQDVLSPDAEGTYFIYRFSDPTYLMAQAVVRVLADLRRPRRIIDVCGGSGHLTRDLALAAPDAAVALADVYFWKLWLAKTFAVPTCHPLCCDANAPLPFGRESFDMVVLSDAFPYIWHKRALAEELMRLAGPTGIIGMPHLHSSLGFNYSAGMTLTPAAYAELFAFMQPRLFRDSDLQNGVFDRNELDLSAPLSADAIGDEPSVTLVATRDASVFARHTLPDEGTAPVAGQLNVNPLYSRARAEHGTTLTLTFPTEEYEEEFGGCRRYLPDRVRLTGDLAGALTPESIGPDYVELRRRHVLLDVPPRFL